MSLKVYIVYNIYIIIILLYYYNKTLDNILCVNITHAFIIALKFFDLLCDNNNNCIF